MKKKEPRNTKIENKTNKKRIIIFIIIFLILIVLVVFSIFVYKKRSQIKYEERIKELNNIPLNEREDIVIKSTKNNKIEKEGIEAKDIYIKHLFENLEINATLVNNNKETVKGFFIEIELLDSNNEVVTFITYNVKEDVKPGEEYKFNYEIAGIDNINQIVNARIGVIRVNNPL